MYVLLSTAVLRLSVQVNISYAFKCRLKSKNLHLGIQALCMNTLETALVTRVR